MLVLQICSRLLLTLKPRKNIAIIFSYHHLSRWWNSFFFLNIVIRIFYSPLDFDNVIFYTYHFLRWPGVVKDSRARELQYFVLISLSYSNWRSLYFSWGRVGEGSSSGFNVRKMVMSRRVVFFCHYKPKCNGRLRVTR